MNLADYEALSFDCYGTLIDWEAGLSSILARWAREAGLDLTDEQLLVAYAANEESVERENPTAAVRYTRVCFAHRHRSTCCESSCDAGCRKVDQHPLSAI